MDIKKLLRLVNTNFKPTGAVLVVTYTPAETRPDRGGSPRSRAGNKAILRP